jgi:PAS domain S-box-containing protein
LLSVLYQFLENSPESVTMVLNGRYYYVNQSASELLGYSAPDEVLGKEPAEFIANSDKSRVMGIINGLAKGETHPLRYEFKLKRVDDTELEVETYLKLIHVGENLATLAFTRDISQRKIYERRLEALHNISRELVDAKSLQDVIDITLYTITCMLGFHWGLIGFVEEDSLKYSLQVRSEKYGIKSIPLTGPGITVRTIKTGKTQVVGDTRLDPDYLVDPHYGRAMLSELAVPIIIDGVVEGVVSLESEALNAFSENDLKLMETLAYHVSSAINGIRSRKQIKIHLEELERSNRDLDDYTYVVSHDLKAPLRTIKSFTTFLSEDYGQLLDDPGKDYLRRIDSAANNMDHLIEDLLLLSRVGRKFTENEEVNLNEVLEEIKSDQSAIIAEKNCKVIVGKLPSLRIQRIWAKQIFANLVNNGLKFNESKSPTVEVSCIVEADRYVFAVKDNGIGVDERYHTKLFKIFERLDAGGKFEGTGAGLAISKKIAEYFRGEIWVESKLGVGSTFFFSVPRKSSGVEEDR